MEPNTDGFTLELLHFTDQEAATAAIQDAPNLSAVLAALEAEDLGGDGVEDNTLVLSSGDAIIPGVFFSSGEAVYGTAGIADIQIQNELGVQAMALGNHEFDLGTELLAGLISGDAEGDFSALVGSTLEGLDFEGADFPYLSTNLDFTTDANLAAVAAANGLPAEGNVVAGSTILETGGEQIGVVGATTPTLRRISSPGDDLGIFPVEFDSNPTDAQLDELAAIIQTEVDALLGANPEMNKVVLLAHMQDINIELALAERLENVDIIVAGGSNTRLLDETDRLRDGDSVQGEYPQFVTNAGGTSTAVVNTDGSYKYVGRLVIDFDADGNIVPGSYDAAVSGAYATDAQGVADLGAENLVDPEIQAIVDAIEAQIIETEGNVFGASSVYLNGNRAGVDADPADLDGVRTQETNLGNLTADANLAAAKAVDPTVMVSFKNGGGIRADIGDIVVPAGGTDAVRVANEELVDGDGNVVKPQGGVSQNDIEATLAFNNDLTLLTLTKSELVLVLEEGLGAVPSASGGFPQVAGLKVSYDPDLDSGARILNAAVVDENGDVAMELVRDGAIAGDPNETVRVVTLNFLANGGASFPSGESTNRVDLTDLDGDGVADEATTGVATFAFDGSEQDAMAEYLAANFVTTPFAEADTPRGEDERIQNLNFRDDTVFVDGGQDAAFTLELLHFTDQEAATAAIEDAPNLSAVLAALKAEDLGDDGVEDNTLVLSSGDAIIPGVFFDSSEAVFGTAGIADIEIQNELGVQAIALGNHEFDLGTEFLAGLISGDAEGTLLDGSDFEGADFPYLSTNLDFSTDANLAALATANGQAPQGNSVTGSTILETGGEQIGVVGATTPTLASIASPGGVTIAPIEFDADPTPEQLDALAAEIQLEVDALLAANPDMNKVVLLAHMQRISIEQGLAERLENVDIIVAGGSNTRLFDENDRARDGDSDQGAYPQFITNAGGTTTALVNTDGSYKYVGRLVLDFDADGNIIPASYDADVSGAYATDAQGVADLGAENLVDPEIQAIVDAIEAQIVATEGNVFGASSVFLNGNRSGVAEDPADLDGVRTQETNLGNLTADANLAEAKKSDPDVVISLKNGGGIRADIGQTVVPAGETDAVRLPNEEIDGVKPAGGISQNDIATTLAFNNDLVVMTLTTEEIVALLEHGVGALPDVDGRFPQLSGVKLSFDPDLEPGDRILNAAIHDENDAVIAELVRDGEVVDNGDALYKVVTLGFLAAPRFEEGVFTGGGDGYPFPNTNTDPAVGEVGPDAERVNITFLEQEGVQTGAATFADDGTEQDALAEYLAANFTTTPFAEADTPRGEDERIQNLNFREDTVFEDGTQQSELDIAVLASFAVPGSEIITYDPATARAFVTSGDGLQVVDVLSQSVIAALDPATLGFETSDITSASAKNGVVAVALPADAVDANGQVLFFDTATLELLGAVEVGVGPDMVTFSPDGAYVLTANEAESAGEENEPDALPNPNGSVSVIAFDAADPSASSVTTLEFTDPSLTAEALVDKGVRINPNAPSVAADIEPEYIAVEGNAAFITLQENNAVAVIRDIANPAAFTIDEILPQGLQDHTVVALDPSNRDDGINIANYDVSGLRQADAIATYSVGGVTYYLTANEGDGRDVDESRGADLVDGDPSNGEVDANIDPELRAQLEDDAILGRLKFSNVDGDADGDGDIDELVSFGGRSFTIYDENGAIVFDSGDDFERITAAEAPEAFNSNGAADSFDSRSDDKGPEPEAIEVGQIGDEVYAFIGLERVGGVMIYNITDPANASFVDYVRVEGDIGPEGFEFIAAEDSPTGVALLAVASEVSETVSLIQLDAVDQGGAVEANSHIEFALQSGFVTAALFAGAADGAAGDVHAALLTEAFKPSGLEFDRDVFGDSGVDIVDPTAFIYDEDTGLLSDIAVVSRVDALVADRGAALEDGDVIDTQRVVADEAEEGFGAALGVTRAGYGFEGGYGSTERAFDGGQTLDDNEVLVFTVSGEGLSGVGVSFSIDAVQVSGQADDAATQANLAAGQADVVVDFWASNGDGGFTLMESVAVTAAEGETTSVAPAEAFDTVTFRAAEEGADDHFLLTSLEINTFSEDLLV